MTDGLPRYADLPRRPDGSPTAWGLLDRPGAAHAVGRIGLIDDDAVRAAAGLVQTGAVISLNASVELFDPPLFGRSPLVRRRIVVREGYGVDDVLDNFYPQGSSQWDGLGHVSATNGRFYGDTALDDAVDGSWLGVDGWAERGIVGRGILLDLPRTTERLRDSPGSSYPITVDDLENARKAAGVQWRTGDIMVYRTGYLEWYASLDLAGRARVGDRSTLSAPGLEHSSAMAEYLWDSGLAALASDTAAVEVWPPDNRPESAPFGNLHRIILGELGFALGELWALDELAAACARDERYEFFLTSAPLNIPGGAGSPANALAIR
jgi:kynurenine formamidase